MSVDMAVNAIVVLVINAIGYASVRRELVALRRQHQTVVEDHEQRITKLEKQAA